MICCRKNHNGKKLFAPIVAESMLMMRSTVDIVARNERLQLQRHLYRFQDKWNPSPVGLEVLLPQL